MPFRHALYAATLAALAVTSCAIAQEGEPPIGEAVKDLPLFDAHIHYKEPAWDAYSEEDVITLMDSSGVAMGLVSSTPDEGTIRLLEFAPQRIVPELRPYHGDANSSNWTKTPEMKSYLEGRLDAHAHEGIGEFHIRNRAMWDAELFTQIIAMAKARDIFLHVHSGAEPIAWLYDLDPDVKVIWAHAGLGEPPATVYDTMKRFPNLMADTSLREFAINGTGDKINPKWRKIIFEFQDRLMIGSDTWVNDQWDNYARIMESNRAWLAKLPRPVAEKIAYKNAERLFGRTISMELIGKR